MNRRSLLASMLATFAATTGMARAAVRLVDEAAGPQLMEGYIGRVEGVTFRHTLDPLQENLKVLYELNKQIREVTGLNEVTVPKGATILSVNVMSAAVAKECELSVGVSHA